MSKKCLLGDDAKNKLKDLLTVHPETKLLYYEDILKDDKSYGYFKNDNLLWTAFDNRTGYCCTEECSSELRARFWLMLDLHDRYNCPLRLNRVKPHPDKGVVGGIESSGFEIINEADKIFKRGKYLFKACLIENSTAKSGEYSVLLCPIIQYEHYNRLYECFQFNDVDETNKFCELNKEYGVLATQHDNIFVAKITDKGKAKEQ